MIISRIATPDFIYFDLHAEEVFSTNYLNESSSAVGIFVNYLTINTLDRLIKSINLKDGCNLVFNFKGIEACQSNLNKQLFNLKGQGFKLLLINLKKTVAEELSLNSIINFGNVADDNSWQRFYFFEDEKDAFVNAPVDITGIFSQEFKSKLKPFIEPHTKPHSSSLVYLKSYVDVKRFISFEKEFLTYSLYKLAIKIKNEWGEELAKKPILVCQSMNSAYIVSVLANLLCLDLLILDKIGPVNKLYQRMDKGIDSNRRYIVVSDLVCLGTEVKIVKNLIQFMGGKYLGNVALIKTETLAKSDIKRFDATKAIFSINRSNNKELGFNITTDLEQFA